MNSKERVTRSIFDKKKDKKKPVLSKPIRLFDNGSDLDTPMIEEYSSEREIPKRATSPQPTRKSKQYSNLDHSSTVLVSPKNKKIR